MVFSECIESKTASHGLAIDMNVGGNFHSPVDQFLETLIAWSIPLFGLEEITKAKDSFIEVTGKVFPDEDHYHSRIQYFLYHFLFEREVVHPKRGDQLISPFNLYKQEMIDSLVGDFTHSLFRVTKINHQNLIIHDLFSDHKYRILKQEHETFSGIQKSELFQGFIFHLQDSTILSRGLIFHPPKAHRIVLQILKDEKKSGCSDQIKLLDRFAKQQLKQNRLKHVDPKKVYGELRLNKN